VSSFPARASRAGRGPASRASAPISKKSAPVSKVRPRITRPSFRAQALRRLSSGLLLLLLAAHCSLLTAHSQASWVRQKSGTLAWLHGLFFVDESRGWAVGSRGALLSTSDGGATWRKLSPPSEDALRDIFFVDPERGWIVCERSVHLLREKDEHRSYLLRTDDGGRTWSRVEVAGADVDARLVGVRFAGARHGWAYGELGALYSTSDGGETWARRRVPTRHLLLDAELLDERRGWVAGAGATLLRTDDGGLTWRAARLIERAGGGPAAPADAGEEGRDGGRAVRFNAVEFADARSGWVVGSGGAVYATSDGGATWRAQVSEVAADLYDVEFADARRGWAVGYGGVLLRTEDGGRTWEAEASRTPHTLERLFLVGRARGWAVGFGGSIISYGG
jgi:photosystem II stability/assembly factor-like uncharacterized protein